MASRNRRGEEVRDFNPQAQAGGALPSAVVDISGSYANAGAALERVSGKIGERADAATRIEAKRAGAIAGAEPDFRPTGGSTIAEATYDQAATATYIDKLDAKVSRETREAYTTWAADPNRQPSTLTATLNDIRDRILKDDAFPEIRGQVEARFERLRLPFETQAASDLLERARDGARAATVNRAAEGQTTVAQLSTRPNDPAALKAIEQERATIHATYDRAAANGEITQEKAALLKQGTDRDIAIRLGESRIAQMKTVAEVEASEKTLEKEFAAGKLKNLSADAYDRIKKAHSDRRDQLVTQGNADARLIKARLNSVVEREKQGLSIDPQELEELKISAARSDQGMAAYEMMEAQRDYARRLRGSTPEVMEATAKMMRDQLRVSGGKATQSQNELIGFVEGMASDKRKALATNPLGEADRTGLLKVTPFDVSNTEQLEIGMARRVAEARAVARSNGRETVYFQPGEIDRVKAIVAQGGDQALRTVQNIVKGAGNEAPAVLREIGNGAPELAHVGNLLRANIPQQRDLARDALEGVRLKQQPGAKLPSIPSDADDDAFKAVFGNTLSDNAEDRERIRATARSVFATRAARFNIDPKTNEGSNLMKQVYSEVAGRVKVRQDEYGGADDYKPTWFSHSTKIVLPQDIKVGRFGDVISAITDADLAALPGGGPINNAGEPMKASALARSYPMRTERGWQFSVTPPGVENRVWLKGSDGRPFTLDLDAMTPRLRSRVPDAFLGGR